MAEREPGPYEMRTRMGLGVGLAVGMVVGVALGSAFDDVAVGIGTGLVAGLALAMVINRPPRRRERPDAVDESDAGDPDRPPPR